jgi:two-component system LytT family sensor kinase
MTSRAPSSLALRFRTIGIGALAVALLVALGLWVRGVPWEPFRVYRDNLAMGFGSQRGPEPPHDLRTALRLLGVGSVIWYVCVLSAPLFLWLAHRSPIAAGHRVRATMTQVAALLGAVIVATLVQYDFTYHGTPRPPSLGPYLLVGIGTNILPLGLVFAAAAVLAIRRRAARSALETERLRAELAEARLSAVSMQLHPHFLFNTLQSISTLIHRDPKAADEMLGKLADLLQDVLRRSSRTLVSLDDELHLVRTYLDLARLRFGDRLRVEWTIADDALGLSVPVLLLQPLVENSLKHGVGARASGGEIRISAERVRDRLKLGVADDGVGLSAGASTAGGLAVGMRVTHERLRHLYQDDYTLELAPRSEGGVMVSIDLPARLAEVVA